MEQAIINRLAEQVENAEPVESTAAVGEVFRVGVKKSLDKYVANSIGDTTAAPSSRCTKRLLEKLRSEPQMKTQDLVDNMVTTVSESSFETIDLSTKSRWPEGHHPQFNNWRKAWRIKKGRYCKVWFGTAVILGEVKPLAVKEYKLGEVHKTDERAEKELKAMASLDHPNIAGYHGYILDYSTLYLFTEFIQHGNLAEQRTKSQNKTQNKIPEPPLTRKPRSKPREPLSTLLPLIMRVPATIT